MHRPSQPYTDTRAHHTAPDRTRTHADLDTIIFLPPIPSINEYQPVHPAPLTRTYALHSSHSPARMPHTPHTHLRVCLALLNHIHSGGMQHVRARKPKGRCRWPLQWRAACCPSAALAWRGQLHLQHTHIHMSAHAHKMRERVSCTCACGSVHVRACVWTLVDALSTRAQTRGQLQRHVPVEAEGAY